MKNLVIMDPWGINFHAVVVLVIITVSAMEVALHEEIFHYIKRYFITSRDISLQQEKFYHMKKFQSSPMKKQSRNLL